MNEGRPFKAKNQNLKTQISFTGKIAQVQLGKLVRLPHIRKIAPHNNPNNISRKSLEARQTHVVRNSNKQTQTGLGLMTLQQIELCQQKSKQKDVLPRLQPTQNPLLGRQRSVDSLQPQRLRTDKSFSKLQITGLREYKLGSIIGRGTYSIVRIAKNKQGKKVAIKTYLRTSLTSEDRKNNLQNQIQVLLAVNFPNLLKCYQTFETQDGYHIVTQLFQGKSLAQMVRIEPLHQDLAKSYFKQLIKSIAYLHGKEILHRDLKMENVLISKDGKIKLIDYGFSLILPKQNTILYDYCGTPNYIAPQVIQRQGYYGKPADIWSLGVLVFRTTIGYFPYNGLTQKNIYTKMKGQLKTPQSISSQLRQLLFDCLNFDFTKRPTIDQLLQYKWLRI